MRLLISACILIAPAALATPPCLEFAADEDGVLLPSVPVGSEVPPNVTPLVAGSAVLEVDTEEIAVREELITVTVGSSPTTLRRLVPESELPVGTTLAIVAREQRFEFVVGSERDESPPSAPDATLVRAFAECQVYADFAVDTADDVIAIARVDADPVIEDGAALDGLRLFDNLLVAGPPATRAQVRIATIDHAGNMSEIEATDVDFPLERLFCAQGRASSADIVVGAALVITLRRARRRQRSRSSHAPRSASDRC